MSVRYEKDTEDFVIEGFENGIAPSPHKGIGFMQGVNIATETGEVMCSYSRIQQSQVGTTPPNLSGSAISTTRLTSSTPIINGTWITISSSSVSGLSTGDYFVVNSSSTPTVAGQFQIASTYQQTGFGGILSWAGSSGSITFNLKVGVGQPIASATEPYNNGSQQYRYYILDNQGLVWVYDTALINNMVTGNLFWTCPDPSFSYFGSQTAPSGIAILNGFLHVISGNTIWVKPTVNLDQGFQNFASGVLLCPPSSSNPHFAFTGHQGKMYYTDGNFIGSIFANTSLLTGGANIQSYASYTAVTTTATVGTLIGGSLPTFGGSSSTRIPAVFFHATGGSNPAALTIGTIYYIQYSLGAGTFQVFAASSGGSALDAQTGSSGTQYFDTYYPISAGGEATITFSPERLNLPFFETSQSIAELGSSVLIGCKGNTVYPWNQVDATPSDLINLPESNVPYMLTVNNMVYIQAGFKGNIYITSGSSATLALTVPDYTSGLIEPYFTWGGMMYLRGRVYFSILDQTASHTGQCGGVWSFIPTQNFYIGQDTGIGLRLENRNSYGTYNGLATVLLANQDQSNARGPQYWSGWYSSITSPLYGIDYSDTVAGTPAVIQTDFIPTGTAIDKMTFSQIEYKLATPLASGDSVQIFYRVNLSDAFVTCGAVKQDSTTALSGYFDVTFQKTQWVQFQVVLTPNGSSTSSFVRLSQIRYRQ